MGYGRKNKRDVLIATSAGVFKFDRNDSSIVPFSNVDELSSSDVFDMTIAPDQSVWLSLWEGGVAKLSPTGEFLSSWKREDGLQRNSSNAIKSTKENEVFVLNASGLFRLNKTSNLFEKNLPHTDNKECNLVNHINTDPLGRLWVICEHNSLWKWQSNKWMNYSVQADNSFHHIFVATNKGEGACKTDEVCFYLLSNEQLMTMAKFCGYMTYPRLLKIL